MRYNVARLYCILIDDGLGDAAKLCETLKWHDQFTKAKTKRIVRVEVLAQVRSEANDFELVTSLTFHACRTSYKI